MPRPSAVREVEAALRKLPAPILAAMAAAGQRVEVIAGKNAAKHPRAAKVGGEVSGMAGPRLAVIAADCYSPEATTLHEAGHLVNHLLREASATGLWRDLWQRDKRTGQIVSSNSIGVRVDPAEWFAESFRLYHQNPMTRELLSRETQNFFAGLW